MAHTALIYTRRSSETGDDYSLDTQAEACLKYAATHDLSVAGDVVRENFTGTKHLKDREQGEAVWAKIQAGEIDSLIVYAVDRLSRGKARQVLTLIDEILDAGVQLHSVDVGQITDTDDIGLIIRSWQAGEERKKIVDRLMRGKMGKAMSGKWPGDAPLPYGYVRTGERKTAEIHIIADLAQNVRLIYDLYTGDQAIGMRGIATALHQRGIASPEGFPIWSLNTIRRVLMNPLYAGRFVYRGVEIPLPEMRLVTDAQWQAAQDRRARNIEQSTRNRKRDYLMAGRLRCGECDLPMHGMRYTDTAGYDQMVYRCSSTALPKEARTCHGPKISVERVDEAVWEFIRERLTPDRLAAGLAALDAIESNLDVDAESAALDRRIQQASRKLHTLLSLFDGNDAPAVIAQFTADVNAVKAEISAAEGERRLLHDRAQREEQRRAKRQTMLDRLAALQVDLAEADFLLKRDVMEIVNARAKFRLDGERARVVNIASDIAPAEDVTIVMRRKRRNTLI